MVNAFITWVIQRLYASNTDILLRLRAYPLPLSSRALLDLLPSSIEIYYLTISARMISEFYQFLLLQRFVMHVGLTVTQSLNALNSA